MRIPASLRRSRAAAPVALVPGLATGSAPTSLSPAPARAAAPARSLWLGALVVALGACAGQPASTPTSATTAVATSPTSTAPASGATTATTGSDPAPPGPGLASTAPTASAGASAGAGAAPSAGAGVVPASFPAAAEWEGAPVADVDGAKELGCEARAKGEWVLVACRGFNYTGAVPTDVVVEPGPGAGRAFRLPAEPGMVALGVQYVAGTAVTARILWGVPDQRRFTHTLTLAWPDGKPRPATLGKLSDPPKKGPDPKLADSICKCEKEQFGDSHDCSDVFDPNRWVPECVRTFITQRHCQVLNSCQEIEMNGKGTCMRDEAHYGFTAMARCGLKCNPKKPECPEGKTCLGAREQKTNDSWVCQ
ncbi:MAG: hypothetical protein HY908_29315 [Myxococcales bacterium]|nr:hypothetical protein [Myxococcales bacterium]